MSSIYNVGKDLTKEAPRSPYEKIAGFVILARAIDKGRAKLFGNIGEYNFDCPLDNALFGWKGVKGSELEKFIAEGHSDEEIGQWVRANGFKKTDAEIETWNEEMENDNYDEKPLGKKQWLSGECVRLGLDKDATLFDYLVEDDRVSFKKGIGAKKEAMVYEV